jgi:hypothetical protein
VLGRVDHVHHLRSNLQNDLICPISNTGRRGCWTDSCRKVRCD